MASNRNQPATKSDGEMRAVAGYTFDPQGEATTWKLLASLHERRTIPELCAPAWPLLHSKKEAELK
jgi:hypothetical protein